MGKKKEVTADVDTSNTDTDGKAEDSENGAAPLPDEAVVDGKTIRIAPPDDYAVCAEVVGFALQNTRRAFGAALGLCWRGGGAPKTSYAHSDYNVGKFGGAVINELNKRGISEEDWQGAALIAFRHMVKYNSAHRITEKEVAATVDFSKDEASTD